MSGASLIIDDAEINAAIDKVFFAGGNTEPLMQAINGYMLFSVQRRFETERGPDGTPWRKLSPRTANRRIGKRRRGEANILRVKNRLYQSITREVTAQRSVVGTNLVYAGIHQSGGVINMPARQQTLRLRKVKGRTRFARKTHKRAEDRVVQRKAHQITIPARPYLGFSPEDRSEILTIAQEHYQKVIEEAGK